MLQSEQRRRQRQLLRAACNSLTEQARAWQAAVTDGGAAAAGCCNATLQLRDVGDMDLGVLADEAGLVPLLKAKLARQASSNLLQLEAALGRLRHCAEQMRRETADLHGFSSQGQGEKAAPTASMSWQQAGGILLAWVQRFAEELVVKEAVAAGVRSLATEEGADDRSLLEQTIQVHLTAWRQETRVHQPQLQEDLRVLAVELDSL